MMYKISNVELEIVLNVMSDLVPKTLTIWQMYWIVWKLVEKIQLTARAELQENWLWQADIDVATVQEAMNVIADWVPKTITVWHVYKAISILQNLKPVVNEKPTETSEPSEQTETMEEEVEGTKEETAPEIDYSEKTE